MTRFTYVIVDDDHFSRTVLYTYLNHYPFLERAGSFSSAADAKTFLEENEIDILFSDIEMPEMNGLELLSEIGSLVAYSVFITSHPEFALDSYQLSVNDYILKPIEQDKIQKTVDRLKKHLETQEKASQYDINSQQNTLTIKDGYRHRLISMDEIIYLEAFKDYTRLVLVNGDKAVIHGNLSSTLKNERFRSFIRIHKSYAVQKKQIKAIETSTVTLSNKITLPFGRAYKNEVREALI